MTEAGVSDGAVDMSESRRHSRSQFFLSLTGDVSEASDLESPVTGIWERLSLASDVRHSTGSDVRSERLSMCSEASAQTVDSSKSRSHFYVDLPSDAAESTSTSRTPVPSIKIDAPEDEDDVDGGSSSGNDHVTRVLTVRHLRR